MPPTSPSFFAALVSNRNCRSTANLSAVPIIVNIESGSGERASDAAISGQADYVTYVSNRPSSAKHEVWVYDRANDATHKVTDTGSANGGLGTCSTSSNKPAILSKLQAYWGDPAAEGAGYDMSVAGVSAGSYSSCQFLAAAGLSARGFEAASLMNCDLPAPQSLLLRHSSLNWGGVIPHHRASENCMSSWTPKLSEQRMNIKRRQRS